MKTCSCFGAISRLLFIVFVFTGRQSYAGHHNDSLLHAAANMPDDTNKVNIFNQISNNYGYDSIAKSEQFAIQALNLARKLDYKKGQAEAHNNMGNVYFYLRKYPKASDEYNLSFALSRKIAYKTGIANF